MVSQTRLLLFYATFLLVSGFTGFAIGGFHSKAKTSIIMGGATAAVMLLCAFGYTSIAPSFLRRGVSTLSPLLIFLFGCIFAWRAHLSWNVKDKQWLVLLLSVMSMISWFVFVASLSNTAAEKDRQRAAAVKQQ